MAEASGLGASQVTSALAELCSSGLVTHDREARLSLFCDLPDRGARPANGRCVKMYFRLWKPLPHCAVKFQWIALLHWMIHPFTADHARAWDQTFRAFKL